MNTRQNLALTTMTVNYETLHFKDPDAFTFVSDLYLIDIKPRVFVILEWT